MKIKPYKTKITSAGNSLAVLVPAWVKGAFEVHKGDEVVVRLEKINKDDNSRLHDSPVV